MKYAATMILVFKIKLGLSPFNISDFKLNLYENNLRGTRFIHEKLINTSACHVFVSVCQ